MTIILFFSVSFMMLFRLFIFILGLILLAPVYGAEKPNIVFLLADDMSRDTWGAYGGKDCKTPNIDKLAHQGVIFKNAYCTVAMCAPFRQELYSGRTPWRTTTLANHSSSTPDTKSIAHYLKPLGYRTALIGKGHIGPKQAYPFERFKANKNKTERTTKYNNGENDEFMNAANNFMDSCAEDNSPFCLFIASHDSHAPFTTGDSSMYDASKLEVPPYWLDTPILRENMRRYYAEISNFDTLVGRVRIELESRGLWRKTIFIVCSEQGTQLPFAKWTCYDNGLHTGLVAHCPELIQPGSKIDELISIADITPTLVEIAGGKLSEGDCDGKSFMKLLEGKSEDVHQYVYGAFTNCNIIHNNERIFPIRVIRDKSFSLIYNPNYKRITSNLTLSLALKRLSGEDSSRNDIGSSWVKLANTSDNAKDLVHKLHHRPEFEFYNRENDPYELKNEILNPEYAGVVQKMKAQLKKRLAELGDEDPIETEKALVR
ncbi:MAG: sulfatase [Planctomycetes bacterium]|nr:sulfatase [Planctomycetota bacterium]